MTRILDDVVTAAVFQAVAGMGRPAVGRRTLRRHVATVVPLVKIDLAAHVQRDPAIKGDPWLALGTDGFQSVARYRVSHSLWSAASSLPPRDARAPRADALALMALSKRTSGVEFHPGSSLAPPFILDHAAHNLVGEGVRAGPGLYMLHGTVVAGGLLVHGPLPFPLAVVGETVVCGAGCTLGVAVVLGAAHIASNRDAQRHPVLGCHVQMADGVHVLGSVRIGSRVRIGTGALVTADVGDDAVVEARAVVRGAVGAGARVGTWAYVGPFSSVPDGGFVEPGSGWPVGAA